MTQDILNVNHAIAAFSKPSVDEIARLFAADCVYLASANTGPSISSPPQALSAMTMISSDGRTAADYKRRLGCGVNARNRLRALAVATPCGLEAFYDLDLCTDAERVALFEAVLSRPLVCHQAQDFLGHMLVAKPDLVTPPVMLDIAVMVRALEPELPYSLAQRLALDPVAADDLAGKAPTSLAVLCGALELPQPGAEFWQGRLWQLTVLSGPAQARMLGGDSHRDTLASRLGAVRTIFDALTCPGDTEQKLRGLQARPGGGEFFAAFEQAPFELARLHARGLPVDAESLNAVREESSGRLPGLVEDLVVHVPALLPLMATLLDEGALAGTEVRRVLGGYCAQNDFELPCDVDGHPKIGFDSMILSGADVLPGIAAWAALDDCKRERKEAADMLTHSVKTLGGRRMHPVMAVTAVTGRTSCREPNAQGLSKRMKKHVRARDGFAIVEADAGAIEIRIAAAMAVKAMAEAEASGLVVLDDVGTELGHWFQRVKAKGMPLVQLLRDGRCPHDHVAAGLSVERDEAKLANFSMLYLITPGGLYKRGKLKGIQWTRERAKAVHAGWREQFPEVAFCAAWTQAQSRADEAVTALLPVRYGTGQAVQDVRLHRATTLGGRPLITHDDRILNQVAQGSGATMILKSLSDLPLFVKDKVVMSVHDSIVLEAPLHQAESLAIELAKSMALTISQYLSHYGIPTVVDVATGPNWGELIKISRQFA